jgi:hypothetical protein
VSKPIPEPLKLPNSALEPIDWSALGGWATDDHAAAFATFVTSCRPLLRTILSKSDARPIAVDNSLHVYGTPFFIQAGLPATNTVARDDGALPCRRRQARAEFAFLRMR